MNPFKRGDEVKIRNFDLTATDRSWCGINSSMINLVRKGGTYKVTGVEDSEVVRLSCGYVFHIEDLCRADLITPYKDIPEKQPEVFNVENLVMP